jgi:hypothetical protein
LLSFYRRREEKGREKKGKEGKAREEKGREEKAREKGEVMERENKERETKILECFQHAVVYPDSAYDPYPRDCSKSLHDRISTSSNNSVDLDNATQWHLDSWNHRVSLS